MSLERFEDELRKAAPADGPSTERRAASRAAVMAAAGLAVPTPGAATSAAATKTALGAKLVIAVLAASAVVAVVLAARSGPPQRTLPIATTTAVVVEIPAPPVASVAAASATSSAVDARAAAPPRPAVSTPDPLAIEASLLEAARLCLNGHDLACASGKLAEYDQRFPHGALADEATLLRIDAARARGDAPEARRLAELLLAAHPSGSYGKRARAVLSELKK